MNGVAGYLCDSALWSAGWFLTGALSTLTAQNIIELWRNEVTTPERLKRRQMIEGTALLVLGMFTVLLAMYFRVQDTEQRDCFESFIAADAATGAIRSKLVEDESAATRRVISSALSAGSRADLIAARVEYEDSLQAIDQGRRTNQPVEFNATECDQ